MAIPLSRTLDFDEIPQIDAAPLLAGNESAVIDDLRTACEHVGFFYVRNHGVVEARITELRRAARAFFEEPMDRKLRVRLNARMQGYLPLDYSSYEGEAKEAKSHQEGFWMSHDRAESPDCPLEGPNIWPSGHPELRRTMEACLAGLGPLADALLRGFAAAAELDPAEMTARFRRPLTRLKLNHYPPQDRPETEKHIGVVAHSDSDAFTILWQDEGDGLEIRNKAGEWIGAPSIPGTFVINIGNIMQIWTGGRFPSTPHRVINRGGRDRYSIPLFVYPDPDVRIGPLGPGGQAPADAVECCTYLRNIWRRTFPIAGIPDD